MPAATKDLSLLGSTLEMQCGSSVGLDGFGSKRGSFHYKSGTGTILLEGTMDVGESPVWFTLVNDSGSAIAAVTAAGLTNFPIHGYSRIRARNTIAGVANVSTLGFN